MQDVSVWYAETASMERRGAFLAASAAYALFALAEVKWSFRLAVLVMAWLASGGVRWCWLLSQTWRRDFTLLYRGVQFLLRILAVKRRRENVVKMFRRTVAEFPKRAMLVDAITDKEWTYAEVESYSNRVANFFLSRGFKRGQAVALFMENRPEYIAIW